jgi:large subunit ribosomal protein L9
MKVILKQNIDDHGKIGEIINVSNGFARNYLIPKGLAAEASSRTIQSLEHEKKKILQKAEKEKHQAQVLMDKLSVVNCAIARRVGEQDKLFGSVNTKDIECALKEHGVEIDRKYIVLDEPIKALGEFMVKIKIAAGYSTDIKVQVVREG